MFVDLLATYKTSLEVIDECAAVDIDCCHFLSHILEVYKILLAVKHIVLIGGDLLNIIL